MSFRLALIQPLSHKPPDDEKNVADAVRHIAESAAQGADVVAFPETYPGPWQTPMAFDPTEAMVEAAAEHGVMVQFGTLEPIGDDPRAAYNVLRLATPDGVVALSYRRTHPPGPWIYAGGVWDFDYRVGDEYPVVDTPVGRVGLAMCSEAYMPEVTRAMALRGAEILFLPAGIDKLRLWATWRNLIWSRAIENLAVVVTTQNLFDHGERGLAMVATPEEIVFETTRVGSFLVDVDLDRVRELRADTDGPGSARVNAAKAGVLTQWQRPEMYDRLFPAGN